MLAEIPYPILVKSLVAGLLASLACGLGALPLAIRGVDPEKHTGLAYGVAGGLMFAASVYNLILPGLTMGTSEINFAQAYKVVSGVLIGAAFLGAANRYLSPERLRQQAWQRLGSRREILIFVAMAVHSIPEGVAVGVGYASDEVLHQGLGTTIALAIGIHNIPEGLAVAVPLRAAGASLSKCFWAAVLTSIPQPIAALPAALAAWFFQPLMPILMGFAAGAMIFLIVLELIPEALESESAQHIAWAFMLGFCVMLMVQVIL